MSYFRKCMKFKGEPGTIVGPGRFDEYYVIRVCEHGLEGHVDFWTPLQEDLQASLNRPPQSITEAKIQGVRLK